MVDLDIDILPNSRFLGLTAFLYANLLWKPEDEFSVQGIISPQSNVISSML